MRCAESRNRRRRLEFETENHDFNFKIPHERAKEDEEKLLGREMAER